MNARPAKKNVNLWTTPVIRRTARTKVWTTESAPKNHEPVNGSAAAGRALPVKANGAGIRLRTDFLSDDAAALVKHFQRHVGLSRVCIQNHQIPVCRLGEGTYIYDLFQVPNRKLNCCYPMASDIRSFPGLKDTLMVFQNHSNRCDNPFGSRRPVVHKDENRPLRLKLPHQGLQPSLKLFLHSFFGFCHIQKPFSMTDMTAKVREVLDMALDKNQE